MINTVIAHNIQCISTTYVAGSGVAPPVLAYLRTISGGYYLTPSGGRFIITK